MAVTIIGDFFTKVNGDMMSFIASGSSAVAKAIAGPVITLLIATWIVWWLLVAFGQVEDTVWGAFKKFMKIVLIAAIALNSGNYMKYIAQPIYQLPDQLAMLAIPKSFSSTVHLLDNALIKGDDTANAFKNVGTGFAGTIIWWIIAIYFVWIPTIIMVGYGAILLLLTKFYLGILLAIGMPFIICLFWKGTKVQFELWLKQILTLVFTTWLSFMAIAVVFKIWDVTLAAAKLHPDNGMTSLLPMLIFAVIGWFVLYQSQMIARGLGGGWHLEAYAAAGFIAGALFSPVARSAKTIGNLIERRNNRPPPQDPPERDPPPVDQAPIWPSGQPDVVQNHYQNNRHHDSDHTMPHHTPQLLLAAPHHHHDDDNN